MRLIPIRIVAATLGLVLVSRPAAAQQPGWVDPPDKPAAAPTSESGEAGAAAQASPSPSSGPSPSPAPSLAPSHSPTPARSAETPPVDTARRLALAYLATVSSADMAEAAPRFYGRWVRFHDRLVSRQALIAEKRRFVRRWPERRYEADGEPRVICSDAGRTCIVRALLRFEASSTARGRRSRGTAEVTLTIRLDEGRPVIVAETSRVLRRGLASHDGARFIPAG